MVAVNQIVDCAHEVAEKFSPERIILFGSYAYGQPTEDSDIDLLVVMNHDGSAVEQAAKIRSSIHSLFPVDVLVRSSRKIQDRLEMGDLFVKTILEKVKCSMKPLTLEWIEKADGDFHSLEREVRARKYPNYDAACFHAQQCAEKYIKGRLTEAGIAFPKTHDRVLLLDLTLTAEPLWEACRDSLSTLSGFGVEFRYPGESADIEMAKSARMHCCKFRAVVRESMGLS